MQFVNEQTPLIDLILFIKKYIEVVKIFSFMGCDTFYLLYIATDYKNSKLT